MLVSIINNNNNNNNKKIKKNIKTSIYILFWTTSVKNNID